ncbi:MAG: hypothetical protein F7O42_12725 [Opitutae bacterium]|nr:hypothetical protein [Opitutae bacterium]
MKAFRFKVFELPTIPFDPADYKWSLNKGGNLEGHTNHAGDHTFTWQPNGGQFTILRPVSGSARSFEVKKPAPQEPEELLESIGYSQDWVTFL